MTDLDLDNLDLLDDDEDENYVRIRKTHLDQVRGAAKNSTKFQREAEGLKKEKAFADAGLNDLSDAQRDALTRLVEEPSADKFRDQAVALGFVAAPEPPTPPVAEAELAEHDAHAEAANGAGAPISTLMTATDMAGWSQEERKRFASTHPDLAETLARGGTINRPPGFAA